VTEARNRSKIKICGVRDVHIASYIAEGELRPDYVGFVFAPSRRQVSLELAGELAERLGATVAKVGVFVDAPISEIIQAVYRCRLEIVQLHGNETPEFCRELKAQVHPVPIQIWKSWSIGGEPFDPMALSAIVAYRGAIDGLLLDTYDLKRSGGTGKTFAWTNIPMIQDGITRHQLDVTLGVAGGIHEGNVDALIQGYRPDVVDVSSGIETNGLQDYEKIRSLIEKVKS
jgi:phosphoribosylanthranilate isomerase